MNSKPEFILASYVTYKELYKCEKYRSPYQILAEFIKYVICENKMYQFSSAEMKKLVMDIFGFKLPNAVLKSTLKKIECVNKISGQDEYNVDYSKIKVDSSFENYRSSAEKENLRLIEKLIDFTEKRLKKELLEKEKKELSMNFMAYLLDESNGGDYQDSISTFILNCTTDDENEKQLQAIREGCILYTGINYSIDEVGSITDEIYLYLDMEVLFDLYGYNGEVFQTLAEDMLKLIQEANKKKKYIFLKYFQDTKKQIEDFFLKAEEIVSEKTLLKENAAMKAITTGCKDVTDVIDKKSDFFYTLQYKYGISEDTQKNYYGQEMYDANLEGIVLEEVDMEDPVVEQSIKLISNINKLRQNKLCTDYLKSGYLFITETWKTLDVSRKIISSISKDSVDERMYAGCAVNMSFITNLLWYKLNNKFGINQYPQNINAVIKAKIVLSNYISQNVAYTYEECKKNYDNGNITKEQYAARILVLKNKNIRPEEITVESVEDDLDFAPENIKRFEEESKMQKVQLQEKNEEIEKLKSDYSEMQRKIDTIKNELSFSRESQEKQNNVLQEQEKIIGKQCDIINQQNELIERFKLKEKIIEERKHKVKKIIEFVKHIMIRILVLIIIGLFSYYITKNIETDLATRVSIIVTLVGIVISCIDISKNVFKKVFGSRDS